MPEPSSEAIFHYRMTIAEEAIDGNGHVNNVMYVQWMQEAAIRHFDFLGGTRLMSEAHATWVVRSHMIEYFQPAFAGEEIEVRTWIANLRRVRSLRRYEFVRKTDGTVLVTGETEWVFVDAESGKPTGMPESITRLFPLL